MFLRKPIQLADAGLAIMGLSLVMFAAAKVTGASAAFLLYGTMKLIAIGIVIYVSVTLTRPCYQQRKKADV